MSKVVTENTNYTNIATAIRRVTGRTGLLKPAEMSAPLNSTAEEITSQTDIIEQIKTALNGKGGNAKRWSLTIAADQTSDVFIVKDEWLLKNKENSNLCILLVKNIPLKASLSLFLSVYKGNGLGPVGDGFRYVARMITGVNSGEIAADGITVGTGDLTVGSNPAAGYFGLTDDGSLYIGAASGTGIIYSGDYTVIAWLM